ncbi:amino acid adenylation domain-containing protein [Actinospica robiniae]|uniref:amino acid adenylation domain-containing protein n=1 Tax=Actinospica robiniae TaxID=304901 RepID=UPI00042A0A5C|nr:amino acid adenylation domain-containing protein [Actinospica robiniae]
MPVRTYQPTADLDGPPLDAPASVLDLISAHWSSSAAAAPRAAVSGPEGELGYRELERVSAGIAAALLDAGARPGEPVIVRAGASAVAIAALLGVLRAGARFVAIDPAFPPERQERMIAASGARLALAGPDTGPMPAAHADSLRVLALAQIEPADGFHGPRLSADAPAYTCFTSGSTGTPKGAVISHGAIAASTAARLQHYPEAVTGFVLCSSLSFDSAYAGIFWTLAAGATLLIPSERAGDLGAIGRAAADPRASHLLIVPTLYAVALRGGLAARFARLAAVIVAGEACPRDLVRRHFELLPQVALDNEYGPTECAVWCTVHRCSAQDAVASGIPIGVPIPGARLRVRTAGLEPVPAGGIGELWVAGPGVAMGYAVDSAVIDPSGGGRFAVLDGERSYRTGDLVSVRPDGALDFHGRADRQLKLGGMRIELEEIEAALAACPGVAEAGIGVAAGPERKVLVAAVVASGEPVSAKTLRTHLLRRVPAAAVPSAFTTVADLPRQPNGKLDRIALDRLAAAGFSAGSR